MTNMPIARFRRTLLPISSSDEVCGGTCPKEASSAFCMAKICCETADRMFSESVKLVKAAPCAHFAETHKDASHGREVECRRN